MIPIILHKAPSRGTTEPDHTHPDRAGDDGDFGSLLAEIDRLTADRPPPQVLTAQGERPSREAGPAPGATGEVAADTTPPDLTGTDMTAPSAAREPLRPAADGRGAHASLFGYMRTLLHLPTAPSVAAVGFRSDARGPVPEDLAGPERPSADADDKPAVTEAAADRAPASPAPAAAPDLAICAFPGPSFAPRAIDEPQPEGEFPDESPAPAVTSPQAAGAEDDLAPLPVARVTVCETHFAPVLPDSVAAGGTTTPWSPLTRAERIFAQPPAVTAPLAADPSAVTSAPVADNARASWPVRPEPSGREHRAETAMPRRPVFPPAAGDVPPSPAPGTGAPSAFTNAPVPDQARAAWPLRAGPGARVNRPETNMPRAPEPPPAAAGDAPPSPAPESAAPALRATEPVPDYARASWPLRREPGPRVHRAEASAPPAAELPPEVAAPSAFTDAPAPDDARASWPPRPEPTPRVDRAETGAAPAVRLPLEAAVELAPPAARETSRASAWRREPLAGGHPAPTPLHPETAPRERRAEGTTARPEHQSGPTPEARPLPAITETGAPSQPDVVIAPLALSATAEAPTAQLVRAIGTAIAGGAPAGTPAAPVYAPGGPVRILEIQLHPVELGPVTVRLRTGRNGLEINIRAARPETAQLIEQNRAALLAGLADPASGPIELAIARPDLPFGITGHDAFGRTPADVAEGGQEAGQQGAGDPEGRRRRQHHDQPTDGAADRGADD